MDVLIYKTALMVETCPDWVTLGDAVELRMLEGGKVAAYALSKERWILLFGKKRLVRIGILGEQTASLLRPALAKNSHLRVRIVELVTSKLSGDKKARISVSVWGDTKALVFRTFQQLKVNVSPANQSTRDVVTGVQASRIDQDAAQNC